MANDPPPIARHAICVAIFDALSAYPDLIQEPEVRQELSSLASYHFLKRHPPSYSREEAKPYRLKNCEKLRANLEREKAQLELWVFAQQEGAIKAERSRPDDIDSRLQRKREELERITDPHRKSTRAKS